MSIIITYSTAKEKKALPYNNNNKKIEIKREREKKIKKEVDTLYNKTV